MDNNIDYKNQLKEVFKGKCYRFTEEWFPNTEYKPLTIRYKGYNVLWAGFDEDGLFCFGVKWQSGINLLVELDLDYYEDVEGEAMTDEHFVLLEEMLDLFQFDAVLCPEYQFIGKMKKPIEVGFDEGFEDEGLLVWQCGSRNALDMFEPGTIYAICLEGQQKITNTEMFGFGTVKDVNDFLLSVAEKYGVKI